ADRDNTSGELRSLSIIVRGGTGKEVADRLVLSSFDGPVVVSPVEHGARLPIIVDGLETRRTGILRPPTPSAASIASPARAASPAGTQRSERPSTSLPENASEALLNFDEIMSLLD